MVDAEVRTYDPAYVARVRNRPGGFWVLGAVPEAADHALVGQSSRDDVERVLLCSDGITRLTERYDWTWAQVFAQVDQNGAECLIDIVRQAERADSDPRRWRGKRHDDATALIVRFGEGQENLW